MSNSKKSLKSILSSKKFKYGGFSTLLIALVIAAVALVNVGVSALTTALNLQADVTRNSKFTLSATSKQTLSSVSKQITLYAMYSPALQETNPDIIKLLTNVAAESPNITLEYVDLTKNPAFVNRFIGDSVTSIQEGAIIVTRGDESKYRVLSMYDLYNFTYDANYNYQVESFKGEESVINAIVYANSDTSPRVYWLAGHQELASSSYSAMQSYLQSQNYQCASLEATQLDLLERGDTLIVLAPARDLSDPELEQMMAFMADGGRMIYMSGIGTELPNFEQLINLYGIGLENNLVYETAPGYYYMLPNYIRPNLATHDITSIIASQSLPVITPNMRTVSILDVKTASLTVSSLLDTSSDAYGKSDIQSGSTERTPDDVPGPFSVAAAAVLVNDYNDTSKDTRLVVFGGIDFFMINQYGNPDLFLQSVNWMQEKSEVITIVGKSMMGDKLSFTANSQVYAVQAVVLYIIPALVIISGIVVFVRRRHL